MAKLDLGLPSLTRRIFYLLIGLLGYFAIWSSCSELQMVDRSSDSEHSNVIGKKFRLKEDVGTFAISFDRNQPPKYIHLIFGHSIGGREVVSKGKLKKGTLIQIVKVVTPGPFNSFIMKILRSPVVQYVVKVINNEQFKNVIIRVDVVGLIDDATFGLDGRAFEVVQ